MACVSSCATSLAAAVALGACAAARASCAETVLDLSGPAAASFVLANLGAEPKVVPGAPGERALDLRLDQTPDGWTELDFAFGEHFMRSDWSRFAAAELDVENRGREPVTVGLRLRNTPAADAEGAMAAFSGILAAGARARLRVPLLALRFGQGFGEWPSQGAIEGVESDGRIDTRHVVELGLFVDTKTRRELRLRRVELLDPTPKGPWIDERGRSLILPRRDAGVPERPLEIQDLPGRDGLGASLEEPAFAPGSFFRLERREGRWWLVAPGGRPYFASCVGGVNAEAAARWDSVRRRAYAWVPPRSGKFQDAWLEAGAAAAEGEPDAWPSYYRANLIRALGGSVDERFLPLARSRLSAWGFNCLGPWSDERVAALAPLARFSEGPDRVEGPVLDALGRPGSLPDVWAPGFPSAAEKAAAPLAALKDDPLVIGHFFDEEAAWDRAADALLELPDHAPARRRLRAYMSERYGASEREPSREDLLALLGEAAGLYCGALARAIVKVDPNHLLLGPRFSTDLSSETLAAVTGACAPHSHLTALDDFVPEPTRLAPGRPRLSAAYAFNSLDDGLLTAAVPVASRAERGVGLRRYLESCAADPDCVGASYYQYVDQPLTGRADGDTSLNGLVDVADLPYPEVVEAARASNERLYDVRRGRLPAWDRRPRR